MTAGACLIIYEGTTPTLVGSFDFTSQDSDGFTLTVGTQFVASVTIGYLALGGSDITNVGLISTTHPTSTGSWSNTGFGFQPNFMLSFGGRTTSLDTNTGNAPFNIGFTDGTNAAQFSAWVSDAVAASITGDYVRSAAAQLEMMSSINNSTTIENRSTFTSFDTNGFTMNAIEAARACNLFVLGIKGATWFVGDYLAGSSTGNFSETGVGFKPAAVFNLFAQHTAQSTVDTPTTGNHTSIGAFDASAQVVTSTTASHGDASNTGYANTQATNKCYRTIDSAGAVVAEGAFVSLDNDGFTLNATTATAGDRFGIYFAVKSTSAATAVRLRSQLY